ncbi:SulP family inorganic anion transporter, partial [Oleiphilus sp. HI0066]|uniref:SulP family inorganic anion transporter n=3 Tax=Oleiphilus TaxID=141450 RepID=UPI000B2D82CB
ELIGLGASNIASGLSGGMPVTGGFSRSAVNFEAGAATKLSNLYVALGVALAALFLTPYIYYLPKVVLASLIIVAVIGLMEFVVFKRTWLYSKSDFLAVAATVVITLTSGVEAGVISGVIISLCLHLYRTSKPHIAEVGLLEGTEHFRNVKRFDVTTCLRVLSVRQDESLFFANAEMLQAYVLNELYKRDQIAHVIIQCSAVNEVDYSALTMLENLNKKLFEQGVLLHLSEVK